MSPGHGVCIAGHVLQMEGRRMLVDVVKHKRTGTYTATTCCGRQYPVRLVEHRRIIDTPLLSTRKKRIAFTLYEVIP